MKRFSVHFNLHKPIQIVFLKNLENLKVPKRENFSIAFFAQSEPIWVCDLENKIK